MICLLEPAWGKGRLVFLLCLLLASPFAGGLLGIWVFEAVTKPDLNLDLPVESPTYRPKGTVVIEPDLVPPFPPPSPPEPLPPPDITFYGETMPTDEIVFVIDNSSSMLTPSNGQSRWSQARENLIASILQLSPENKFDVVNYHCAGIPIFGGLTPATTENKAFAISKLRPTPMGGSTGTGQAVAGALSGYKAPVALLTDGIPSCPWGMNKHLRWIVDTAHTVGKPVYVFAIDAQGEYENFCRQVAGRTGGWCVKVN